MQINVRFLINGSKAKFDFFNLYTPPNASIY